VPTPGYFRSKFLEGSGVGLNVAVNAAEYGGPLLAELVDSGGSIFTVLATWPLDWPIWITSAASDALGAG